MTCYFDIFHVIKKTKKLKSKAKVKDLLTNYDFTLSYSIKLNLTKDKDKWDVLNKEELKINYAKCQEHFSFSINAEGHVSDSTTEFSDQYETSLDVFNAMTIVILIIVIYYSKIEFNKYFGAWLYIYG